jgi:hypothetical protein
MIFAAPLTTKVTTKVTTKAGKFAGEIAWFLTDLEIGAENTETCYRNIFFMLEGGQIVADGAWEGSPTDNEMPIERPSVLPMAFASWRNRMK